jgi:hypothetical protein
VGSLAYSNGRLVSAEGSLPFARVVSCFPPGAGAGPDGRRASVVHPAADGVTRGIRFLTGGLGLGRVGARMAAEERSGPPVLDETEASSLPALEARVRDRAPSADEDRVPTPDAWLFRWSAGSGAALRERVGEVCRRYQNTKTHRKSVHSVRAAVQYALTARRSSEERVAATGCVDARHGWS